MQQLLNLFLRNLIERFTRPPPALCFGEVPAAAAALGTGTGAAFDLRKLLDGLVWCPTPKQRTTAEKKLTKRFLTLPNSKMTKWAQPKSNILTCLECGSYHERGSICGKCYEQVKQKTDKMMQEMKQQHKQKFV